MLDIDKRIWQRNRGKLDMDISEHTVSAQTLNSRLASFPAISLQTESNLSRLVQSE